MSDVVQSRSRARAPKSPVPSKVEVRTRDFYAGVALVGSAVLTLGYQGAAWSLAHYKDIPVIADVVAKWQPPEHVIEPGSNILPKDTNLVVYYPKERNPEDRWSIHLSKPMLLREGAVAEGTYKDPKGRIGRAYLHQTKNYLVIDNWAADGQVGFSRVTLQQIRGPSGDILFQGTAHGPDCECSGQIVDGFVPIIDVPATLSASNVIPTEVQDRAMAGEQKTLYEPVPRNDKNKNVASK